MKSVRSVQALVHAAPRVSVALLAGMLGFAAVAAAQDANPKGTVKDGYAIHQTIDVGGHIAEHSGSNAVWNTMVNLHTGPRILNQTLDMRALPGSQHFLFDTLFTGSAGYGGDPNNFSTIRMSKGKLYDFNGLFRRDRQYFDYNLFGNPLVRPTTYTNATGTYAFPVVNDAQHLFNTVRRMTDTTLTLFPLSKVSIRAGYSQNIMEGPTYSSIHQGADALLFQAWRNSTDTWLAGIDWKPWAHTIFTYDEIINHFKGNTTWQLTGFNAQLANGTPVSLGFNAAPAASCYKTLATNPPTTTGACNGYLQDTRLEPTRTLSPTEEFRFQTSDIPNFIMNGRISYTDANMHLPNYFEHFNGLETRTRDREFTINGNAWAARFNVSADYGFDWTLTDKVHLTEQFDFQNFRQPATNFLEQVSHAGTNLNTAPGPAEEPDITLAGNFLGQKIEQNTVAFEIEASTWADVSLGYRYRSRNLGFIVSTGPEAYTYNDHESALLIGSALRPTANWKVNGSLEIGYASNAYVQIAPKNFQHYQLRSSWKPKSWATIAGTFNDLERRDNQINVGYRAHNRSFTAAASLAPNVRYGVDLSYGYTDVFSVVQNCYADVGFVPAGATPLAVGVPCGNAVNTATTTTAFYGNSYYNAPTQFGSAGLVYSPVTKLRTGLGYRMSAVSGRTEFLNPRQVPGSLKSEYQTPYASVAYTVAAGWGFSGNWDYYGYGEGGGVAPIAPRNFHGNVVTLGMHYEF
ncbi:MAG TPA: hypothetical protein VJV22_17180 [Acidobacteriaceae bacterium]|nr:hypothetical protein [Acidobacteriaceae bacterium]